MEIRTVAQQLLFSTVPIETKTKQEESIGTGTSFVLSHEFPGHGSELFLVSNKHVIGKAWVGYTYYTTMKNNKPDIGNPFFVRNDTGFYLGWYGHPDPSVDIAVRPISWELEMIGKSDTKAFYMNLTTDIIPSSDAVENADAILPIVFVGYPNGMYDRKHFTPIIRRGITATPIQLDYDGRPVFLIDASVFPGSSGSPVFGYKQTSDGSISEITLLGILAEVFVKTEVGKLQNLPAPTNNSVISFQQMIDLGVVFKSNLILDTITEFWRNHGDEVLRRRESK